MKNEAGLRPMKRAFGTGGEVRVRFASCERSECFMATKLPHHVGFSRCFIKNIQVVFLYYEHRKKPNAIALGFFQRNKSLAGFISFHIATERRNLSQFFLLLDNRVSFCYNIYILFPKNSFARMAYTSMVS